MKVRKGCWTCKYRKIQCDGNQPVCQKCVRARRECQGYETRLSWPRNGDRKRAMTSETGSLPAMRSSGQENSIVCFINSRCSDIELYRHQSLRIQQPLPSIPSVPAFWGHQAPQLLLSQADLVLYFRDAAHLSLVTFDKNTQHIRDVLLRLVVAHHETASGQALFFALLAFSSLRRHGTHQQALQLKISALHSLSTAARAGSPYSPLESTQHLATCMLLGSFEVLLPSGSSDEWLQYIWRAMDIVEATGLEARSDEDDISYLLGWFYYHKALSRFPVNHWRHPSSSQQAATFTSIGAASQAVQHMASASNAPSPPSPNPRYAILNLLSEVCDTLLNPWDSRMRNGEYFDRLQELETKVNRLPLPEDFAAESGTGIALAGQVYQMATRIYLIRAAQSSWEPSTELESLIDKALDMPTIRSCSCTHFFPLFIVACEARTDERRAAILSLIGRAETNVQARNMAWIKDLIQSIWVQYDLYADSDLLVDYLGMISAVVKRSSSTLASFV